MASKTDTPINTDRPQHKNIYVALAAAQAEFTPVAKNKTGTVKGIAKGSGREYSYDYNYADLGDVLKMAIPVLSRHGICVSQPLTRKENGKLYLVTELHHGESETSKVSDGLLLDENQDPQDFGGDMSYWRRYDFTALAGIATEEDKDAQGKKQSGRGETKANTANVQQDPLEARVRQLCKAKNLTEPQVALRLQKYKGRLPQLIAELEGGAPTQEEPQATIDRNADLEQDLDQFAPPLTPASSTTPVKGVPLNFNRPAGKTDEAPAKKGYGF